MSAENPHFKPPEIRPLPKAIETFFNEKNPNIALYIKQCQAAKDFKGKQLLAFAGGAALAYQNIERKGERIPDISKEAVTAYTDAKQKRMERGLPGDMVTEWLGEWRKFLEDDPKLAKRIFNKGLRVGVEEDEFIAFQGGSAAVFGLIKEEHAISNFPNTIEAWLGEDLK